MAKIGNEARLILKLAAEKMQLEASRIQTSTRHSTEYKSGYNGAFLAYADTLAQIVRELETGR